MTFGRYLKHRLESGFLRTLIIAILGLLLCMVCVTQELRSSEPQYNDVALYILATLMCIIATVIPMIELMDFKKRRNLDTLLSFSISRPQMALAHYLSGWIQVMLIYSVSYFWTFAHLTITTDYFDLSPMIPYYFISLGLGWILYSFFLFLFGEGNTTVDGVIFCILGMFVFWLLFFAVNEIHYTLHDSTLSYFDSEYILFRSEEWGIAYTPINNVTTWFQELIEINKPGSNPNRIYERYLQGDLRYIVFWGIVGLLSSVGFVWSFSKRRAETVGDISNSWFGYRTLIPIYLYSMLFFIDVDAVIYLWIVAVVGYFLYRRSFRLKKSDVLVLAFSLIPLLFNLVFG
ncbi:MAG: hypothetical protein IJX28_05505 [Clostridia bacterium]|nr:hypothetical protein [Clostridia bacterium]